MMRFEAVEKCLLIRRIGFEQHLDFVLLLQLAFPVIKGGGTGEERHAGSQFFGQHFGGEILGCGFIRGGAQYNNSIRRVHKSLMKRAAERPDFNYFYNGNPFTAQCRR